jgi:hypothetical protein
MKATGEVSEEAIASMTALNRDAARAAVAAGIRAGTDVTGFGLLGHLYKTARASGVTAVVDAAAVPYLTGAGRRWPRASSPAARGATSTGCGRTPTCPPSTRTRRCCWPTRRPPAGCCWRRGARRPGDRRVRPRAGKHVVIVR